MLRFQMRAQREIIEVLLDPPPPKYLSASSVEHPKSSRSARPRAVVSSAKRREHVWRANGNLLQDLRSLPGWPAKILNSELLVIRYLRDYALGFVLLAVLRVRLALPPRGDFAMSGEIDVDGHPNPGVEACALANRQNAAWFFRRRVGTSVPFPSALLGAIRSKPVKDSSEGASDDGKGYYQARLPRHRPETESSVARNEVCGDPVRAARHARSSGHRTGERCFRVEANRDYAVGAGKVTYDDLFYVALTCAPVGNVGVTVAADLRTAGCR
jgi:hypothetical protein